jgi:hypothetical protein
MPETFSLILQSTSSGVDAARALRAVLKNALRQHGLRCTDARQIYPEVAATICKN